MATTAARILHCATASITEILSHSDLRNRIFGAYHRKLLSIDEAFAGNLCVAVQSIERAIDTTAGQSGRSSSLRPVEKLVLSSPPCAFSALILSLIYSLSRRPVDAAFQLLDVFYFDPLLARTEIAPVFFEEIFLFHLVPVLQWFNDRRSEILSSGSMPQDSSRERKGYGEAILVGSSARTFSRLSEDQATELKELERCYEEVLDENCKVFVPYFKEVLDDRDHGTRTVSVPGLILTSFREGRELDYRMDEKIEVEAIGLRNGRYNPIWGEGEERSTEFSSSSSINSNATSPPFHPQRVSSDFFTNQASSTTKRLETPSHSNFYSESESSSSESETEVEEKNRKTALFEPKQTQFQKQKQNICSDTSCSTGPPMADSDNLPGGKHTPPKDFVCPITSHLFVDPVTLETGQTYERRAIEEWLERGNSTCPITRQKLQSTQLPKSNYVLKRLIASWQEQNPGSTQIQSENPLPKTFSLFNSTRPPSPTNVTSRAKVDGTATELRLAINNLCMSEILSESEAAVLRVEQFWKESNMESDIQAMLAKPAVINGFVEILFNSVDPRVLKATVFLLCELGSKDKIVIQTLTRVESDVDGIVALFKKGLVEAVVLVYLLKPSTVNLIEMDMVESLLMVIGNKEVGTVSMCLSPNTASLLLLGQILGGEEEGSASAGARSVISAKAVESVVGCLEAESAEERIGAVGILLRCMQKNGKHRNIIADKAELAPVLESFMGTDDGERFQIVHFLSELVKLNRRTFNEQVLHIIKDQGAFSIMHTLLVYLQTALQDQCPVVAGLLLQLDLLAEPRKMSMYREEAIDALISCLRNSESLQTQLLAAKTILALQGRFSSSGKPLARAFLLKRAGLDRRYNSIMQKEVGHAADKYQESLEEEKAANEWERKMAFALTSHEFGLLFEALAEGLRSTCKELSSTCFVSATWLTQMLTALPDTGILGAARMCLIKQYISIFISSRDVEDKALAMLAISAFLHDPEGLRDLTPHMKDMMKGLRELKKSSTLASEMLKIFSDGQDISADMWNHKELLQVDCSGNAEVLSIICFKEKIYSGHSDGTLKVWSCKGSRIHLIQETREHTKGITSLAISQSSDRLYSGSLDKSIRVWAIGNEVIHCIQVHDVKDEVHDMVVANNMSCFIPHGAGVKVHSWNGDSKLLNVKKYVKCLALVQGKLYCGCSDGSIQEIDLATETIGTIQNGSRKLIGKANPIHAIQVFDGMIYSASTSIDGAAVKIWKASNFSISGSLPSTSEVRSMLVTSELIYLGCKMGTVEVWCKRRQTRVETLQQTRMNSKVLCMAVDRDEEVLVAGTSDGRIQAWRLI